MLGNLFGTKKKQYRGFSDEERQKSAATRRALAEKKRLEAELERLNAQEEVNSLREEIKFKRQQMLLEMQGDDDDDDDPEPQGGSVETQMVLGILQGFAQAKANQPTAVPVQQVQSVKMSDEEIKRLLDQVPKLQRVWLKKQDDTTLKKLAHAHFPNADPETVERAIVILRS